MSEIPSWMTVFLAIRSAAASFAFCSGPVGDPLMSMSRRYEYSTLAPVVSVILLSEPNPLDALVTWVGGFWLQSSRYD